MKDFSIYQRLDEDLSKRDIKERGSKFWNEGKWENFILPLLPDDCSEMTFVDVGCNAGLFLKLAKEKGFKRVIGVEPDKVAYERGVAYRDKNGLSYEMLNIKLEDCLDKLPVADFTILSNVHYYIPISDWIDYLDRLKGKTANCIIVSKKAHGWRSLGLPFSNVIMKYFGDWEHVGGVSNVSTDGDPSPRKIMSFLFKNTQMSRIKFSDIKNRNSTKKFFEEIDRGVDPLKTRYYRYLLKKRKGKETEDAIKEKVVGLVGLFNSIKKYGQLKPLIFRDGIICDGSHRTEILKFLGDNSALFRETK